MVFPFRSKFIDASNSRSNLPLQTAFALCLVVSSVSLLSPANAVDAGDPVHGQILFSKNSCVVCHAGGENTMDPGHPIKGPAFQQKYKDDLVLENTIRKGFPQYGMPSFTKAMINERDMKDLISYVRTFSKPVKSSR